MFESLTRRATIGFLIVTVGVQSGCYSLELNLDLDAARTLAKVASFGSESQVSLRKSPKNPLAEPLNLIGWGGPKPTPRTEQVLRRFDLFEAYEVDPAAALLDLHQRQIDEPSLEKLHALAQLSYIQAEKAKARSQGEKCLDLYASTIVYAYRYLFDPQFNRVRNEFDPEFRSASELYNVALEGLLRQLNDSGNLRPGYRNSLSAVGHRIDFTITLHGPWHEGDFDRFEFVSDYEVNGLNNTYHTYGLGVPLVAVRKGHAAETPEEQFYPKNLTFPVTAFFRVLPTKQITGDATRDFQHCAIELHDPMRRTQVELAGRNIPLESDITTPLAYYLNDPLVSTNTVATLSLLNAEFGKNFRGLYMLEPYDPNRIPVVMVHGLWSSPVTWMEMFNDLRALPEIRENYQFWFYMYPTGQPFWVSADQMRADLARATQILDPYQQAPMMQQMVLVGHSMGGLVSRMQTVYSDDDFWSIMSEYPLNDLKADEPTREKLAGMWFFEPNPSIRRVITIGTPHRGSEFANSTTKWLGRSFFTLPKMLLRSTKEVIRDNPDYFDNTELITMTTSVDSLAPDSPVLPVLLAARSAPWVTYHNIVGVNPDKPVLAKIGVTKPPQGDGVVSVVSATMDDAASVVEVPAAHTTIHQHPRAILEVRRILLEHLGRVKTDRTWDPKLMPASHESEEEGAATGPTHVAISDNTSRQTREMSPAIDTPVAETQQPEVAPMPEIQAANVAEENGKPMDAGQEAHAAVATSEAAHSNTTIQNPPAETIDDAQPQPTDELAIGARGEQANEPSSTRADGAKMTSATATEPAASPSSQANHIADVNADEASPMDTDKGEAPTTNSASAPDVNPDANDDLPTAPASDSITATPSAASPYPSTGLPPIQVPSDSTTDHAAVSASPSRDEGVQSDERSPTTQESSSLHRWSLFSKPPGQFFHIDDDQLRDVEFDLDTNSLAVIESSLVRGSGAANIRSTTGRPLRAPNVFIGRPAQFDAPLPQSAAPTGEPGLEPGFVNRREAGER